MVNAAQTDEHEIQPELDTRGARLDVLALVDGEYVDIEMQVGREPDIERRCRFYHSAVATRYMPKSTSYANVPRSYVIFICLIDPLGEHLSRYELATACLNDPSVRVDDGAMTVLLNASAWDQEENSEIAGLLQYALTGSAKGELAKDIAEAVETKNLDRKWVRASMGIMTYEHEFRVLNYELERLNAPLEAKKSEADAIRAEIATATAQAEEMATQIEEATAQAEEANAQREAAAARAEEANAQREAAAARAEEANAQREAAAARAEEANAQREAANAQAEEATARAEAATARAEAANAQAEAATARAEAATARADAARAQAEEATARAEAANAQAEAEAARAEAATARADAATARADEAIAQAKAAHSVQRLSKKLYQAGRGDEYFAALDDPALMDKLLAEFGEA